MLVRLSNYLVIAFFLFVVGKRATYHGVIVVLGTNMNVGWIGLPRVRARLVEEWAYNTLHRRWNLRWTSVIISRIYISWECRTICNKWVFRVTAVTDWIIKCASTCHVTVVQAIITTLCVENGKCAIHIIVSCDACKEEKDFKNFGVWRTLRLH